MYWCHLSVNMFAYLCMYSRTPPSPMWTPHLCGHFLPDQFVCLKTLLVSLLWTPRYCGHFLSGNKISTLARFNCITAHTHKNRWADTTRCIISLPHGQ